MTFKEHLKNYIKTINWPVFIGFLIVLNLVLLIGKWDFFTSLELFLIVFFITIYAYIMKVFLQKK